MSNPFPLDQYNAWVLAHPFHRFAGLELVHQQPGKAWCRFEVAPTLINAAGMLHAGILYGLMDATCYLAVLPTLEEGEHAATVDLHTSLVRAAPQGARIALRAEILRRVTNLAFLRCEAQTVEGAAGTIASATITKAIGKGHVH
jgi:uncharacterized protein (TIGR00369 family)